MTPAESAAYFGQAPDPADADDCESFNCEHASPACRVCVEASGPAWLNAYTVQP